MIRHMIMFKVKPSIDVALTESALNDFVELKNKLPGILAIIATECQFHDDKSSHFFNDSVSHCISIDFEDQSAYDKLLNDPITHPAKSAIVNIIEGGFEGLIGFDLID